jgi:hypothetical protein
MMFMDPNRGRNQDDNSDDATQPNVAARLALLSLEDEGRLTPECVLEAAEDEDSPLHRFFEWDNDEAAHQYRIDQARRLIRGVRVVVTYEDHEVSMPRYVRDLEVDEGKQGYVNADRVRKDPGKSKALMLHEMQRAFAHVQRAINISDGVGETAAAKSVASALRRIIKSLE